MKMSLKAWESSDDCVASATSYLPLSDRIDLVAVCACAPLTQEGATNVRNVLLQLSIKLALSFLGM